MFFKGKILLLLAPVRFLGGKQPKLSLAIKEKAVYWVNIRIIWKAIELCTQNWKDQGKVRQRRAQPSLSEK